MALSDDLLAYVPEDKRKEFSEKVAGYVVLSDDIAVEHVKKSQSLTDRIATPIVEARFKNYKERDYPKELEAEREKIRLELTKGKEETPEQKELREMREWKAKTEKEKADDARRADIRQKAKDLGLDPLDYEPFYALPDADAYLKKFADKEKAFKDKIADMEKAGRFGAKIPLGGSASGDSKETMKKQYEDLMKQGRREEANRVYIAMAQSPAK
jgi:hypothetical protein